MSEPIARIISETLASGVEPLRRRYRAIYDGYGDVPTAYFTETEVFTSATGVMTGYEKAVDGTDTGRRLSLSNIRSAAYALERLHEKEKNPAFVTAFVTRSFLTGDVKEDLASLEKEGVNPDGICLAFYEDALVLGKEKAREGISEARSMGYQTAICDFSGEQSVASVSEGNAEYVFFSEKMTALTLDRNKPGVFTALTSLLKALRFRIVLCGVKNDAQMREGTAAECYGVIPDDEYVGEFTFPKGGRDLEEILTEEDDVL